MPIRVIKYLEKSYGQRVTNRHNDISFTYRAITTHNELLEIRVNESRQYFHGILNDNPAFFGYKSLKFHHYNQFEKRVLKSLDIGVTSDLVVNCNGCKGKGKINDIVADICEIRECARCNGIGKLIYFKEGLTLKPEYDDYGEYIGYKFD